MTRAPNKSCAYCGQPLQDDRARFEVRVAPDYPLKAEACPATYCHYECWEAAKVRKSVQDVAKGLITDAETVLSDEGKIFRRL